MNRKIKDLLIPIAMVLLIAVGLFSGFQTTLRSLQANFELCSQLMAKSETVEVQLTCGQISSASSSVLLFAWLSGFVPVVLSSFIFSRIYFDSSRISLLEKELMEVKEKLNA